MTLPTPRTGILQRRFGGPDAPILEQGDCWATAVACYGGLTERDRNELHRRLCLSAAALQRAGREDDGEWWEVSQRFLRGLRLPTLTVVEPSFVEANQEFVYMALGPSPRGDFNHQTLALGTGELFWDPHPSGDGVAEVTEWIAWYVPEEKAA
ncbi:MAG: hypothetical protein ACLFWM_13560 [Actinomycetota bacterium]